MLFVYDNNLCIIIIILSKSFSSFRTNIGMFVSFCCVNCITVAMQQGMDGSCKQEVILLS